MRSIFLIVLSVTTLIALPVLADDPVIEPLAIKDHVFTPNEIDVPAGQKIKIVIKNEDPLAMEFESTDLDREKVIPANGQGLMYIGPLKTGTYGFYDDYHRDATGKIIAK